MCSLVEFILHVKMIKIIIIIIFHDFITQSFKAVHDIKLYSDLPGYLSPSIISGDNFRPDLLLILLSHCLYVLELTISYESNLYANSVRKEKKYR